MTEWWEWIPVVSTIGHALSDPPGRDPKDYASCAVNPAECGEPVINDELVRRCKECIDLKLVKFQADWFGLSTDIFKGIVGSILEAVAALLAKKGAAKAAIGAAAGVGLVLIVDSLADLAIQFAKARQMEKAAAEAKALYCKCS